MGQGEEVKNMKTFKQIAQDSTQLSDLYNNRKKIDTQDVINKELTIVDFDLIEIDDSVFCCMIFEELDGFFYNGGMILTKMVKQWADAFGGLEEARNAYKSEPKERVKIRLTETKAKKSKNNLVTVETINF